jgi:hypothetical protein
MSIRQSSKGRENPEVQGEEDGDEKNNIGFIIIPFQYYV